MKSKSLWVGALAMLLVAACSSDDDAKAPTGPDAAAKSAVVKQYVEVVRANYADSLAQMKQLQTAIDAFVAAPSQAGLENAKTVWTAARVPYLETEAYRFYNGPIDNDETGPEGAINGWPLDENFIDYTFSDPTAGLINKKDDAGNFLFPEITKDVIDEENGKGGDKNLSAGWHAIEFLLWGQDLNADGTPHAEGPGQRPYTDYVDGGTAANQDRRRAYLKAATDLMVEQFSAVVDQWNLDNAESYGAKFVAGDPNVALTNILNGIGSLAATELPRERMDNAYQTKDQEEEHSCFSDTTNQDLVHNGVGIENVYLGRYGATTGSSLDALVKSVDAALADKTRSDIAAALTATKAIPAPFDQAILGEDSADGRVKVKAAIDAWQPVADDVSQIAEKLGLTINLDPGGEG